MDTCNKRFKDVLILGAGPAGLAAGHVLTSAGKELTVIEGQSSVGGLSKTIEYKGFKFDLGGHRFLTENKELEQLVRNTLQGKLLTVARSSKILLDNKYYDYPIELVNALSYLGFRTSVQALFDYIFEQTKHHVKRKELISLEDWIVHQFGKTLYDKFFKNYTEKVWGISGKKIAKEWAAQRIQGLSLSKAIKNALKPTKDKRIRTLTRSFLYPTLGFGQISESLRKEIELHNEVRTNSRIIAIHHSGTHIESVTIRNNSKDSIYDAHDFVSSIPVTVLINLLDPPPPAEVREAIKNLKFRDMIIVTVMINKENITDQTWIYTPDASIPFGRIHEPKNWSPEMAPKGKTHLVTEYFCFNEDEIWNKSDDELSELTIEHIVKLGFATNPEIIDSVVLRIKNAYPVFEVGYQRYFDTISNYLSKFTNLYLIGRSGLFKYYNSDHAMESGIIAGRSIIEQDQSSLHCTENNLT